MFELRTHSCFGAKERALYPVSFSADTLEVDAEGVGIDIIADGAG